MKTILCCTLAAFAAFLSISGCGRQQESNQTQHSGQLSTHTGEYYTCPMHPSVRSDKPGACPVCHMSLVKATPNDQRKSSAEERASVELSSADMVLANISTAIVEYRALVKNISAVGIVDLAETSTKQITSRFAGRIERLFILCCGQTVGVGQPVAEIYSPEAVAAQREFLVALNSTLASTSDTSLLTQARLKLSLLGFTDQQLDQLAKDKIPSTNIIIYSPVTGTVLTKNVDLQQYISAGESLFDIADLQSVWLQLDVYEPDLAEIHIGQVVEASLEANPSWRVKGTVSSISPTLDPATRTAQVRVIVANPSGNLKPGMYVHATIRVQLQKTLVVPATAIVSNGKSDVVWVETDAGHFNARQVVLGERSGEFYQILEGLQEGESVAVSGAYLIDSESQLRRATAGEVAQ